MLSKSLGWLFATCPACWLVLGPPAVAQPVDELRIEHVTVVSPERATALRDAEVVVRKGRITAISPGGGGKRAAPKSPALIIDGHGLYLTPGLIDSHVHLGDIPGMNEEQEARHPDIARAAREQIPRSFLLHGFTTLVDLISTPEGMARWKAHELVPDTYFCGGAALMDGYPMNWLPKPERYQRAPYMLIEPGTEAPAGIDPTMHTPAAVVTRMKADGAICVKTFFERGFGSAHNLPVPKVATIRELVRAAHAAGLPVLIHANSSDAQAFAVEAGVDIIAHGLWNWRDTPPTTTGITPAIKKILDGVVLAGNIGWQPTIQVLYGERDLFDPRYLDNPPLAQVLPASLIEWYRTPEGQWFHDTLAEGYPKAKGQDPKALEAVVSEDYAVPLGRVEHATSYLATHGARLRVGTDTPSAPTYANPPGLNGWLEMQRLVEANVTPAQIFQAATLSNARALRLDGDIGTVSVGKKANLLLLRADPTQTVQAYSNIAKVILGGRVLEPEGLVANRAR
jgi:imidazolonepropionase-like amidohydrolase